MQPKGPSLILSGLATLSLLLSNCTGNPNSGFGNLQPPSQRTETAPAGSVSQPGVQPNTPQDTPALHPSAVPVTSSPSVTPSASFFPRPSGSGATPIPLSVGSASPAPGSLTPSPAPQPGAAAGTPTPVPTAVAAPVAIAQPGSLSVALTLRETSGIPRTAEWVRSGVPLPRSQNLLSTANLRLTSANGQTPARFTVLGRWNAPPLDQSAPIRWVLVEFPADVSANGSATYTLSDAGAGQAPARLSLTETAGEITVSTGAASFLVSKTRGTLVEAAWLDLNGNGQFEASEQVMFPATDLGTFVVAGGTEYRGSNVAPAAVQIEDSGLGSATIRLEGFHHSSQGTPLLRYVTRLTFYAGQSQVRVHHTFIEGRVMGTGNGDFEGGQQRTALERAGLRFRLAPTPNAQPWNVQVAGDSATPRTIPLSNTVANASIRQRPVTNWQQPLAFEVRQAGTTLESGQRARQAWLDLAHDRWGLAAATRDFWRKGPQSLQGSNDGTLEVQFPAEAYTIYQAMGLNEEILLNFHQAGATASDLRYAAQGPLKDPLFAVAPPTWYAASGALEELSVAPSRYPAFDSVMDQNYQQTLAWIDEGHAFGLMNYLDMPVDRFDGNSDPHRIDWGNSYYDAPRAQIREFARRGDYKWLRDLAFPHIRHWFTTDCYDTDDPNNAFNGISGLHGEYHRGAFTAEYHYMESLWDYYYLTGDRRALERGLAAARSYANAPAWENNFDLGLEEPGLTTRTIGQKLDTLAEGYLASGDATLLAALHNDSIDFVTVNGRPEGFMTGSRTATSPYLSDQAFMQVLIYLPALWKVQALTGNAAVRDKVILTPKRVFQHHRCTSGSLCSTGIACSATGFDFFNMVSVTPTGGGNFTVGPSCPTNSSDDQLYDAPTTALVTALCRSAALDGDRSLLTEAKRLFETRTLPNWSGSVWDKDAAQYSRRAAAALACMEQ